MWSAMTGWTRLISLIEDDAARWLTAHERISVRALDYHRVLGDSESGAAWLAAFPGSRFDSDAAAAVVAPQLRSQYSIKGE
jgi:hypothetical protein